MDATQAGTVIEFFATVTDICEESRIGGLQRWQLALDHTEFAAVAGRDSGVIEAATPRGSRLLVPILGVVVDAEGEVWHLVEKPLTAGTRVTARVGAVEFERSSSC